MNDEIKKRLADYFDPGELIELLGVKMEDVIEIFSEEIKANLEELTEIMDWGTADE